MNRPKKILTEITSAPDIRTLNKVLTDLMTDKKIHAAIEGKNLDTVIDTVLELNDSENNELLSAAVLGRLAAVARGREEIVYKKIPELFYEEPDSIEFLADGDEKYYASVSLRYTDEDWLTDYCLKEALSTDSAEKARRELFRIALDKSGNLTNFLETLCDYVAPVNSINDIESRSKRIRRIFITLADVIGEWNGECGVEPGEALDKCFSSMMKSKLKDAEQEVLFVIAGSTFKILQRIIALRFSHAFDSETFKVIGTCKRVLGHANWSRYVSESTVIENIRIILLEAAVVLARQNRTDDKFINLLTDVYGGKNHVEGPVSRHFTEYPDIDPEIREWWIKAGDVRKTKRQAQHKVGISEDQQIGALMIEVQSVKEAMDKLERAIIPALQLYDPASASTVKKATAGYVNISRIINQLANMRKLFATNQKGQRMEYNPLEHEMLGGHKPGVRRIKIVRDGVYKNFAGKIKTLVKCWVEPEE